MADQTKQAKKELPITDRVMHRVADLEHTQGFVLPQGYNASNALNKALIYLQTTQSSVKGVNGNMLDTSDPNSVAQTLFDMVIQGLSPNQTQVYFIQRHDYKANTIVLNLQRSYFGTQMVLKRLPEVKDIKAFVVYKGDELKTDFDLDTMQDKIVEFKHNWENQDNAVEAALAVIYKADGGHEITVMTKKQIDKAWSHAQTDRVQKEFPDEMAKRTVINRAAKNIINTSTGNQDLLDAINHTTESEYDNERKDVTPNEPRKKTVDDFIKAPSQPKELDDPAKKVEPTVSSKESDDEITVTEDDPYGDFLKEHHIESKEANTDDQPSKDTAAKQEDLFKNLNGAGTESK